MELTNKKRLLTILIGFATCIIVATLAFKFSGNKATDKMPINTSIIDSQRQRKAMPDSATTANPAEAAFIEEIFADIEKARNATDGWAGMEYGLLLNIKKLDGMRSKLTPEQLQLLEMYKQENPEWENVDE